MLENYALIVELLKEVGEIRTRKKFQKMVYLLQQNKLPFNEGFGLHFYGPYSAELQLELDQLADAGLISQEFKGDSYEFKFRKEANALLEKNKEFLSRIQKSEFRHLINELNNIAPNLLESMSTIVYLEKSYGQDKETIRTSINNLKPHLEQLFDKAWENLTKLDLHAKMKL
jgi:uncharacterized protein YwgA